MSQDNQRMKAELEILRRQLELAMIDAERLVSDINGIMLRISEIQATLNF